MKELPRVAIFISGRGSNMVRLIEAMQKHEIVAQPALVLSDQARAEGLKLAANSHIETCTIERNGFSDRASFEKSILDRLNTSEIDFICLAGFMRLLSGPFCSLWQNRMINIHPSLLPLYPGLNTHARALENGDSQHGCTVHYVTAQMDGGPIVAQSSLPILKDDDEESLARRVLALEHQLYPRALGMALQRLKHK